MDIKQLGALLCRLGKALGGVCDEDTAVEVKPEATTLELSPSDWVAHSDLHVTNKPNGVMVNLGKLLPGLSKPPKIWIPQIPGTGSMLPNFNHEHNNILVAGTTKADHAKIINYLQVGDIAVYRIMNNPDDDPADFLKLHAYYAIHRIVGIDKDTGGIYFSFKGDNSDRKDPYKVRNRNILYVSVGTVF